MRTTAVLAALFALLASPVVHAQGVDDASKNAARDIGNEGLEAFHAGRYDEAVEKLERAYSVVKVPGLGLWTARALEKAGKLVEASEIYDEVGTLAVTEGDPAVQEAAKQVAAKEREELLPRIPKLTLQVEGVPADEVVVTLDGVLVVAAHLGAARPANPGNHIATAKLGEQEAREEVTLAEGESKTVLLRLAPAPAKQPVATPPRSELAPTPLAVTPTDTGVGEGRTQRILGWGGLGVGAAGLAFGTVTGVMVLSKKNTLEDHGCVDGACYVDQEDDVNNLNSLRRVSTVGFVIGGVGAAAGAALLLTAPLQRREGPAVRAWLGVGSAGVKGSF